jgi:site-specific recombinase XerD
MGRALDRAVAIFTDQETTDATAWDWSQITVDQVRKLRSVMVAGNAAAGTVNHVLSGVRSTVRIAWELGLVDDKTRIAVEDEPNEKPQQRRRAGRYVKRNEVRRLFAAAPGTDPIGARDAAMLALLYGAGLQRSEAVALQLADYDQESGAITVRHDERQLYATNGGKEAIDAWIASRGDWPGALLCPVAKGGRIRQQGMTAQAVMLRVRTIAKHTGVERVTPNDLRQTYLTELERQQLDARTKGRPEGLSAPEMLSVPYQAPSFDDQAGGK